MLSLSKKQAQKIYWALITDEEIPIEIEQYRDILKYICADVQYTPNLIEVIFSLGMSTKNEEVIKAYLKKNSDSFLFQQKKTYDYFENLYNSRLKNIDFNSDSIKKLISTVKKLDIYHNNSILLVPDLLMGLSTDFSKKEQNMIWTKHTFGDGAVQSAIGFIYDGLIHDNYNYHDILEIQKVNPLLGEQFISMYKQCMDIKQIYSKFIPLYGLTIADPLSIVSVFIIRCMNMMLLSQDNEIKNDIIYALEQVNQYYIKHGDLSLALNEVMTFSNLEGAQRVKDSIEFAKNMNNDKTLIKNKLING